jgi:hypothetical protein
VFSQVYCSQTVKSTTWSILETAREKNQVTCRGIYVRLIAHFSKETLLDGGEWNGIFKILKEKTLPTKNAILRNLSSSIEGEIVCL